jgi:hypothetical protein
LGYFSIFFEKTAQIREYSPYEVTLVGMASIATTKSAAAAENRVARWNILIPKP